MEGGNQVEGTGGKEAHIPGWGTALAKPAGGRTGLRKATGALVFPAPPLPPQASMTSLTQSGPEYVLKPLEEPHRVDPPRGPSTFTCCQRACFQPPPL